MEYDIRHASGYVKQLCGMLTKSIPGWVAFLNSSAYLYKYCFHEQLMIHEQSPDAKIVASKEIWNTRFNRYLPHGTKGIAIKDFYGNAPGQRYVYDYSDTRERRDGSSKKPNIWRLQSEHNNVILEQMKTKYGYPERTYLPGIFHEITEKLANEYWHENKHEIKDSLYNSLLDELDELNQKLMFRNIVTTSVTHSLMARCDLGAEGYFSEDDYRSILYFNTSESAHAIGTAVCEMSERLLREIEVGVKKYDILMKERSVPKNGNDTLARGGRIRSKSINVGNAENAGKEDGISVREIRTNEKKVSAGTSSVIIRSDDNRRDTVLTPHGGGTGGTGSLGDNNKANGEGRGRRRADEKNSANEVGRNDEQHPSFGGGSNHGRANLPIENNTSEPAQPKTATNFRITDFTLGEDGAKTKFRNNVNAIRLLQELELNKRPATSGEQEILSRYVGWGGLQQVFREGAEGWQNEFDELRTLLTSDEYKSARASTMNAHYTTPAVINAIYDTAERLGFKSGNILEPSCGVGNFFGMLPESMHDSKLYGVELDSISGRIAKQLYPGADIQIKGFEKTDMPDNHFDLVIGNVPFGDYGIADKRYDKNKFAIHDYFFAKALDKVRPGGIVAFVTSKYTLDKQNPSVRKYIAQRADLLGAVRLPNDAFLKNAGTETTTDIIFLQKRDRLIDIELSSGNRADWVHLGVNADGIAVNSYFAEHPEMILGTMALDKRMNDKYGRDDMTTCHPKFGLNLAEQLKTATVNIKGHITEFNDISEAEDKTIPAAPDVKNFSYAVVENTVYYRENSRMSPVDAPPTKLERIKGMVELRDCVRGLIDLQLHDSSAADITAKQEELLHLYDKYTAKYGLLNNSANSLAFNADNSYYLLSSLEHIDEDGGLGRKADIFTKRTIKHYTPITSVDTSSEALAVSIGECACVDLDFMGELTGFEKDEILKDLEGVIFRNIDGRDSEDESYVTADEYLSGNVRQKLEIAKAGAKDDPALMSNVAALEAAQPIDLTAPEISVRLGATWIDKKYVDSFMRELLKPPYPYSKNVSVQYSEHTGEWNVDARRHCPTNNILANVTYGTRRINAYGIIHETLNLRDVRIFDTKVDTDGKERRILNVKETALAQQKQEQIKQAFKDWIWRCPIRRQYLVKLYNEKFNSIRPREYNGNHIKFVGANPEITFRKHQVDAIARQLYGGNTLLAHEVGAGKTFEMIAAAMEGKRLGLCQKSLFAVPNHLTEQWGAEFMRLYPSANILVATKRDFETGNRKKFCGRIATGEYDAVIIGHSQFEKIPLSYERQEKLLQEQIDEITDGIKELSNTSGTRFTVKQLEKTKKSIETRLERLHDQSKKDTVVTFEDLGVDRLFVDEAHYFKNAFFFTNMRNVAGIAQTEAQKSTDLMMKCRYMDELTDSKGIVFATGTPISNSMTEMFTMQQYLQHDLMKQHDMTHFDAWASTFGETITALELAPEGNTYRARTRFARFFNVPELMSMFKEVADIKTADTMNLPCPKAQFETIVVEPSELQKNMVSDLSERAAKVHNREVEPNIDNMLRITSDGRKIGLDQRLMNPLLPDDPNSKVNACMNNVYRIWDETKADKLTQLVFCDFSTPGKNSKFNVYDDIRDKLISKGIPKDEIAFIHDAATEAKKKELFAKVRQGKVRVLLGSTAKLGAGTNVQDRLIALHDLDAPWRPSDLAQRAGRIIRQGNKNPEVKIFRYVTNGTFDSYLYQTLEVKQKFISQIMTSKAPLRSCEDVDESALSYAEIKALCAGDDRVREKMDLDIEVARLRLLKSEHQSQRYRLEDMLLTGFPERIEQVKEQIAGCEKDLQMFKSANTESATFAPMEIDGKVYTEKEEAGNALLGEIKGLLATDPVLIGKYKGFLMSVSFNPHFAKYSLTLKGSMSYTLDLGKDAFGNITRINNALAEIPQQLLSAKEQLENLQNQVEEAKIEVKKPFMHDTELMEKDLRLAQLNAELNQEENQAEAPECEDVLDI